MDSFETIPKNAYHRGNRGSIVAQNRCGVLECTSGHQGNGQFIGTRTDNRGREETRKFTGERHEVIERWLTWQRRGDKAAENAVKKQEIKDMNELAQRFAPAKKKEEKPMTEKKTNSAKKEVFVLRYVDGSRSKDVAAYVDQDAALDQAIDLKAALDIAGVSGEYTVESVPLRGAF